MAADFSQNSNTESLRAAKVAAAAEIAYLDVKTAAPALKAEILEARNVNHFQRNLDR